MATVDGDEASRPNENKIHAARNQHGGGEYLVIWRQFGIFHSRGILDCWRLEVTTDEWVG